MVSHILILSKYPDLFALCGLLILFSVTTKALELTVETSIANKPLLINILTVSNEEMTQTVINHHLNDTGIVNNFRINMLASYPKQQHALNAASIPDIQQVIHTEIPQSEVRVDYIVYDNEEWNMTPAEEQTDPEGSTNRAADIVHAAGYDFGVSPSRQLLLEELHETDWREIDLLIIQTQKLVGTAEFKDMIYRVSSTVRSQNPSCIVMVQVNPSLNTIDQIVDATNSVRESIDGVSIIWNKNDASMLDDLLTSLKH
ncbi:MAG: hypothetical protein ACREAW_03620 [Nitrososphaera sp.]